MTNSPKTPAEPRDQGYPVRTPAEEALIDRNDGCWWCIEVERGRAKRCPSHD